MQKKAQKARLTVNWVNCSSMTYRMRERLRDIGLTESESKMYATQSLRRSGATLDAAKGLNNEKRKLKGQWASAKVSESYVDKSLALEMSKKWKR
jgi:hypothetical protein